MTVAYTTTRGMTVAVQTTTQSASANDFKIVYDNLDDALGVLLTGFGDAVTDYLASQSANAFADALGNAFAAAAGVLVAGTVQFSALQLGALLFNLALQQALDPFLAAIDDPSLAADLFSPDDLGAILNNLVPAVIALLDGDPMFSSGTGILDAIASTLQGYIMDTDGLLAFGNPGFLVGDLLSGVIGAVQVLFLGTGNLESVGFVGLVGVIVGGGAAQGFLGTYIESVQSALQPLLQGQLGVVTAPLASLLSGLSIGSLPIPALPFP